jgi:hypothetical protein
MAEAENVENVDVEETVKEVLDTRREFTMETPDGVITHYFITNPSGEDIRKADWQYSKVYNQAIVDGLLTQAEMLELLEEKKIVSDEYTRQLESVRISLGAEIFKLENLMENATEEEKELVALEVSRLRDELFRLNQRVNGPMANTCENLAEDARTDFLTSRVVENKDGSKAWADYDAYRNEDNAALAIKARFEVMLWMQGLESDFLENTPEQTTLREIAKARLDRAVEEEIADQSEESEEPEKAEVVEDSPEELELPEEPEVEEPPAEEKPKKRGRPKGSKSKPKAKPKSEPKKDE